MYKNIEIIAEVKTKSPFGFKSEKTWGQLFEIANKYGDIISIHTDSRWGGSFDLIKKARKFTDKKILAKGIHQTDEEVKKALDFGADYVLTVGRISKKYKDRCFFEPLNLDQIKSIPIDTKVVWNSRDLSNGKLKTETFQQARNIFHGWICQASNIKTVQDIQQSANAILVGENLEGFCKSL